MAYDFPHFDPSPASKFGFLTFWFLRRNMTRMWWRLRSCSHLLSWSAKRTDVPCVSAPTMVCTRNFILISLNCCVQHCHICIMSSHCDDFSTTIVSNYLFLSIVLEKSEMLHNTQDLSQHVLCLSGATLPKEWSNQQLSSLRFAGN